VGARVLLVGDRHQHRSVTAGEPLKLLEELAGLPVAEVTEIMRQEGDYRKAAEDLSEGRTGEAFEELDKLGWIREVPDAERYEQLSAAYLAAVAEKKRGGGNKSALVVSPTHAEGDRITGAIRAGLKAKRKLGDERIVDVWVPTHLTEAEKADPAQYEPGQLLQLHQNAKGYTKGARLIVEDGVVPPVELADRFEVYRPSQLALAVGDRVRVTAGGKTKDGKHRLSNGSLLTVRGFTKQGDIVVDRGWVIDREFGHLAHGYAITSHASQGATVDKVFIGMASESLPATNQRTAYVAITRGREQVQVFTDDRAELLKAMCRPDDPISATELAGSANGDARSRNGLMKYPAFGRKHAGPAVQYQVIQTNTGRHLPERGLDHER
jgi:ATP-dependent exoDNAse (exonuclease V) alpha subunit